MGRQYALIQQFNICNLLVLDKVVNKKYAEEEKYYTGKHCPKEIHKRLNILVNIKQLFGIKNYR